MFCVEVMMAVLLFVLSYERSSTNGDDHNNNNNSNNSFFFKIKDGVYQHGLLEGKKKRNNECRIDTV